MTPRESGVAFGTVCATGAAVSSPAKGLYSDTVAQPPSQSAAPSIRAAAWRRPRCPRACIASFPICCCPTLIQYILCHPFHKRNEADRSKVGVFQPILGLGDLDQRLDRVALADRQ